MKCFLEFFWYQLFWYQCLVPTVLVLMLGTNGTNVWKKMFIIAFCCEEPASKYFEKYQIFSRILVRNYILHKWTKFCSAVSKYKHNAFKCNVRKAFRQLTGRWLLLRNCYQRCSCFAHTFPLCTSVLMELRKETLLTVKNCYSRGSALLFVSPFFLAFVPPV